MFEYRWVRYDEEDLNEAAQEGWRVVPGIPADEIGRLLMERMIIEDHEHATPMFGPSHSPWSET